MKDLKYYVSISALLFLFSCGDNTPDNNDRNLDSRTDTASQDMVNDRDEGSTQLDDDKYYPSSSSGDMTNMYVNVGLSEDQIKRFEDDFSRKVQTLKSNGRGDVDRQSIEATKDQSMRTVTSDEEYSRYLDYKKTHPVVY